jgi:hypothetical protein
MPPQSRPLNQLWPVIEELVEAAKSDKTLRDVLQHGTPEQKRAALEERGLPFHELVFIHRELEQIVYQGSLRFWWW